MSQSTTNRSTTDAGAPGERRRRHTSIADRILNMGEQRTGALLLVLATVVAIVWANVSAS